MTKGDLLITLYRTQKVCLLPESLLRDIFQNKSLLLGMMGGFVTNQKAIELYLSLLIIILGIDYPEGGTSVHYNFTKDMGFVRSARDALVSGVGVIRKQPSNDGGGQKIQRREEK